MLVLPLNVCSLQSLVEIDFENCLLYQHGSHSQVFSSESVCDHSVLGGASYAYILWYPCRKHSGLWPLYRGTVQ